MDMKNRAQTMKPLRDFMNLRITLAAACIAMTVAASALSGADAKQDARLITAFQTNDV